MGTGDAGTKKRPDGVCRGRNSDYLFRRKYPMRSDMSRGMSPLEGCRPMRRNCLRLEPRNLRGSKAAEFGRSRCSSPLHAGREQHIADFDVGVPVHRPQGAGASSKDWGRLRMAIMRPSRTLTRRRCRLGSGRSRNGPEYQRAEDLRRFRRTGFSSCCAISAPSPEPVELKADGTASRYLRPTDEIGGAELERLHGMVLEGESRRLWPERCPAAAP